MKKALVVLLILAVAGGAFAEITFGGSVEGAWQVLNGIDKENDTGDKIGGRPNDDGEATEMWTRFGLKDGIENGITNTVRARLSMNAVNEEGTLGAFYQFRPTEGGGTHLGLGNIWWQPISQFKATLGYLWGGGNLSAGVASPNDVILPIAFWGRAWGWRGDRAMHGYGWEVNQGAHIELFPMESLYIVVSVPTDQTPFSWGDDHTAVKAMDTFAQTAARVAYTITDIGQIGVTWDGGTMTAAQALMPTKEEIMGVQSYFQTSENKGARANAAGLDPAYISAHFNLTAVENLALSVVFDVPLPITKFKGGMFGSGTVADTDADPIGYDADDNPIYPVKDDGKGVWTSSGDMPDINIQLPFTAAVQAGFTAGAFHIDGGIAARFLGSVKYADNDKINAPLNLGVTLNPVFDAGIVKVGLVGEVNFTAAYEEIALYKDRGTSIGFNVIPYVQKDLGGGSIYAGFALLGTPYTGFKDDDSKSWKTAMEWSIPVGFQFYF